MRVPGMDRPGISRLQEFVEGSVKAFIASVA
jgi:hypothetical protein